MKYHGINHFIKTSLRFINIKSVSRLEAKERAYRSLKPKLSLIQKSARSAEEKVKDMDVLLMNAIMERKALRVENHRLDSKLFEATSKKQEMIAEEKMISAEINVSYRVQIQFYA